MHRKHALRALSVTAAALCLSTLAVGCTNPCVEECERMKSTIVEDGRNAETGEIGGLDAETVCEAEQLRAAADCDECREAFAVLWGLESPRHVCECTRDGDQLTYRNTEDCSEDLVEPTDEICDEIVSDEYVDRDAVCDGL